MQSNETENEKFLKLILKNYGHKHYYNQQMLKKNKTKLINDIICPDQKSSCPSGTTCCKLSNAFNLTKSIKFYGCCPIENAICCADHLHCCPKNTTCDLHLSICITPNVLNLFI